MSNSIWATLSAIDCSKHVEKKGQFSYLSWSWCWSMVKERYPAASFRIEPDIVFPDDTVEVRMTVQIEDQQATMWLPVMDFKNNAKPNPTARDISDTRMRCLVKCVAVGFGLGHYIYAGESLPQEPVITFTTDQRTRMIDLIANNDGWGLKKFGQEVGNEVMSALFSSFQKGEVSKTKAKVRDLVGEANTLLKEVLSYIREGIEADSPMSVEECFSELTPLQNEFVLAALTEVEKTQIADMGMKL